MGGFGVAEAFGGNSLWHALSHISSRSSRGNERREAMMAVRRGTSKGGIGISDFSGAVKERVDPGKVR